MLWIKPSDAFGVLLTFSLSPKRQLCESIHQIKPERKQHETPLPDSRHNLPAGYQRRCLVLLGAGSAAPPEIQRGKFAEARPQTVVQLT